MGPPAKDPQHWVGASRPLPHQGPPRRPALGLTPGPGCGATEPRATKVAATPRATSRRVLSDAWMPREPFFLSSFINTPEAESKYQEAPPPLPGAQQQIPQLGWKSKQEGEAEEPMRKSQGGACRGPSEHTASPRRARRRAGLAAHAPHSQRLAPVSHGHRCPAVLVLGTVCLFIACEAVTMDRTRKYRKAITGLMTILASRNFSTSG